MLRSIYKFLFKIISFVVCYFIVYITDLIFNVGMFLYKLPTSYKLGKTNKNLFLYTKRKGTEEEKDRFLLKNYRYKYDFFKGFPDWNCRILLLAGMLDFRGDCDDIALWTHKMFGDGKKYTILPYDKKHWDIMHVVYVRNGKVYSGGHRNDLTIYYTTLDEYVERHYTKQGIETLVQRYF